MVKEKLKGYSVCVCDYCGKEFKRRTAEVNRSIRLGMGQFHKGLANSSRESTEI